MLAAAILALMAGAFYTMVLARVLQSGELPFRRILTERTVRTFRIGFALDAASSVLMSVQGGWKLGFHAGVSLLALAIMAAAAALTIPVRERKEWAVKLFVRCYVLAWIIWMAALALGAATFILEQGSNHTPK